MPVQLHFHAARPLHDGVHTNRILEWLDEDAGARCARRTDRLVHVSNEISGPLETKWIGDRGAVRERREGSDRTYDVLKLSAAWSGRHGGDDRFTGVAAEGGEERGDESVKTGWRDIHVRGIVLRPDGDICRGLRRGVRSKAQAPSQATSRQ